MSGNFTCVQIPKEVLRFFQRTKSTAISGLRRQTVLFQSCHGTITKMVVRDQKDAETMSFPFVHLFHSAIIER